jgi:hypothetical protein
MVLLALGCSLLGVGGQAQVWAGVQEVALEQLPGGLAPSEQWASKDQARQEAFVQALLQEALDVLPWTIGPARQRALGQALAKYSQSLVLSYCQEQYRRRPGLIRYQAQITVNTPGIKERLKDWGTFYTAAQSLRIGLHTKGLDADQGSRLSRWMLISGLKARQVDDPVLTVSHGRGLWRLGLETQGKDWDQSGVNLERAWSELWSRYFAQKSVQGRVVQSFVLRVSGYPTVQGVYGLDGRLRDMGKSIDQVQLDLVCLRPSGIKAEWELTVLDEQALAGSLSRFVAQRGLNFELLPLGPKDKDHEKRPAGLGSGPKAEGQKPGPRP